MFNKPTGAEMTYEDRPDWTMKTPTDAFMSPTSLINQQQPQQASDPFMAAIKQAMAKRRRGMQMQSAQQQGM